MCCRLIEDAATLASIAHDAGALVVASFDPISLGLLKRPGDWGADIAVAEGHTLGTPMQYGGPYLGIMACREKLVRRMPGRIAGETVDRRGKRCFVLTLQTREQHIRREKATSNVCTNQGLFALRATIYLSLLGPDGLRETANLCLQKTRYAAEQLCTNDRFELAFKVPTLKEFVVRDRLGRVDELIDQALPGCAAISTLRRDVGAFVCHPQKRLAECRDRFDRLCRFFAVRDMAAFGHQQRFQRSAMKFLGLPYLLMRAVPVVITPNNQCRNAYIRQFRRQIKGGELGIEPDIVPSEECRIDIFMIAILVGLVSLGELATIQPEAGAVAFAAVVILTMLASHAFDPKLIWDAGGTRDDRRPEGFA